MLVLLQDGCPVLVPVHPRDRLLARLRASRLDTALAAGASPDATVGLSLRAQTLIRARVRRSLAQAAERVLAAAVQPRASRPAIPVCRERVRDCSQELEDLIRRLLAPGPVSAQGIAQACALLTDARSPIFYRPSHDDLRARILTASHSLDPA